MRLAFWRAPKEVAAQLTLRERTQAGETSVYLVSAYGTNAQGWPDSFRQTIATCLTAEHARRVMDERPLEPGWDEFRMSGPRNLLEWFDSGGVSVAEVRRFLADAGSDEAHRPVPAPLTADEWTRAAQQPVYYVWYEDRFHYGGKRENFPVAVCITRADAEAEIARRGRPVQSGTDGYEVAGPSPLSAERRPGVVREVLRRLDAGNLGPVHIPSELW